MKILNPNNPTRKDQLDKLYACELSGWEIAAVTALIYKFAAGDPGSTLRGYCTSVEHSGRELFPFLGGISHLFNDRSFAGDSKEKLLEE